jgi:hypothetical protein
VLQLTSKAMSWNNSSNNNFDPFAPVGNNDDPFANLAAPTLLSASSSSATQNAPYDPFGDVSLTPDRYSNIISIRFSVLFD